MSDLTPDTPTPGNDEPATYRVEVGPVTLYVQASSAATAKADALGLVEAASCAKPAATAVRPDGHPVWSGGDQGTWTEPVPPPVPETGERAARAERLAKALRAIDVRSIVTGSDNGVLVRLRNDQADTLLDHLPPAPPVDGPSEVAEAPRDPDDGSCDECGMGSVYVDQHASSCPWGVPLPASLPKGIACGECGNITATAEHVERLARYIVRNNTERPAPVDGRLDVTTLPEWDALVKAIDNDAGTVAYYKTAVTGRASALVRKVRAGAIPDVSATSLIPDATAAADREDRT